MDRRAFIASGAMLTIAGATAVRAQPAANPLMTDARVALAAYRSVVEEHLMGVLRALKALAATSDLQSGDWERLRPALRALGDDMTTAAAVWFLLPDGAYYTVGAGRRDENLKDRDYFPGLMAGQAVQSALVISRSTGHRSIVVASPVKRNGVVIGAIGVSVQARLVSELIERDTRLPASMVFYALDSEGRTSIHKDPTMMFEYPSDLGDATLKSAVATILSTREGRVEYDFAGTHRTAVFDRSDLTGWSFVLAVIRG